MATISDLLQTLKRRLAADRCLEFDRDQAVALVHLLEEVRDIEFAAKDLLGTLESEKEKAV